MKVLELIEVLGKLDPEADVIVAIGEDSRDNTVWGFVSDAEQVEAGELRDEKIDMEHEEDAPIVILNFEE